MNSKLNQIYQSIEDIRKALGDEAECVPVDELAGMISKLTDDPTRSGFTTTFMFSNDENPNIPQETRLNVNTGLVEDSSGGSQTDFGSATYAMRSQSNDTNWITFAIFGPDGSQKTEWSTPKNLKGEKGERGADGKPGSTGPKGDAVEYIYTVDDYYAGFAPDSENIDGYCPKGGTSKPVGISDDNPTEGVSQRTKDGDKWGSFSKPVIGAKGGYNGKDGNGIEYIYCLTKTEDRPTPPESDPNKDEGSITWPINGIGYDDPKSTSEEFPYCWVSVRKQYYNGEKQVWDGYSLPTVGARWSKDGENGGRTVIIYTRDNDINAIVNKPTNGSGDPSTNEVIDIESDRNWSTDPNDGVGKHLWQSNAVFNDFGEKISDGTSPFRMTGEDGTPGKDGETIQFIYRLISNTENFNELVRYHKESGKELSNLEVPSKIDLLNPETDEIPIRYGNKIESGPNTGLYTIIDTEGTDDPSGISLDYQIECVCSRTRSENGEWTKWSYPAIGSKGGEDGTDGPGVEYIYLITPPLNYDDLLYIPTYKEYQEYDKEYETNYASYFQKDDFIPGKNAILGEQNGSDEPSDVSPSEPIEWVSVRKKKDGIGGDFSKPVIWNKWATNGASFITSYCFTRTSIPLNKYIKAGGITGGNYEYPTPKDTLISVDGKEITIKGYDSVPAGEESVWMISRTFESGDLNPDDEGSVDPSWSAPSLMQDRSDFVVEFTVGHSENPDQKPEPRNLQGAYNEYLLNGKDYISEWRSNEAANDVHGNDNIPDANWMATCHLKNGVGTDGSVVKIKGEKGDKGTDGVCTIIQGQAVIVGCIFNTGEQQLLPNNKPAKYLIQICGDDHDLLIGETDHYGHKDVKIGDSYIVNGDLYVWDGDSFENVGQIQGPEGIAGTPGTNAYFYMAFSNKDSVLDRTVNTPIDLTLKTGKYVGYLSSTIALSEDVQLQSTTYNGSPGNGQDGWGYEQIFLLTKKENGIDWDNGPAVPTDSTAEKDYRPAIDTVYTDIAKGKDGKWSDTPLTPSEDYPFCWIVTRTTNGTEFGEWKGIDGKATLHNRYIVDGIGTPAYHVELTEDNVTVPLESNSTIDLDFKYFDLVATLYAGDEVIDENVEYFYSFDGNTYKSNSSNRFEIKSEELTNKPSKLYIRIKNNNNYFYKNVTIQYTSRPYEMSVDRMVVRKDWKDGKLVDNDKNVTVTVQLGSKDKGIPAEGTVTCVGKNVLGNEDRLYQSLDEANGTAAFDLSTIINPATIRFEFGNIFEEVGVIANGEDGSKVEYIYYKSDEYKTPVIPEEGYADPTYQEPDYYQDPGTDEMSGVDSTNRYEYVSVREKESGIGGAFSKPKLHSYYAKDGEQGPVGPEGPEGPQGPQGPDGENTIIMALSNPSGTFQYSGDSGVASSDEITSDILVLDGKKDVTSECELSYSATEGLSVGLENNTITVTPGTIAVAPGKHEVLITAIYEGVSLSKVLTIICATSGGESAFSISLSDDIFQLKAVNGIVQDTTVPNTSFEGYYGIAECDIEFIKIDTSVNNVRCNVENNKISLYGLESGYNNSTSDTLNIGLTFKLSFGNLSTERTIKGVVKKVSEKMSLFVTPNVIKDTDSFKEIEIYIDYNNQRYSPTQIGSTTVKVNGSTIQESNYPVSGTTKIDLIVDNKVIDSETVPYLFDGENGNTPYIQSGYGYIAGVSTGIKAEGSNGITPEIGDNGNGGIGNKDTGTPVTGVGVESVDVEYAISDSKTEEPTTGGKSQVTGSVTGKFVWSRTKIVYSNSTDPKYSKAACISGEDGNSIETVTEGYYLSTSATELRGGEGSIDYDSSKDDGRFVGTQTRITFTGRDPIETTPVRASGLPGSNGDPAVTHHISTSKLFVVRDSEGNVIPNDENITYNVVKTIGHDIDHTPDLNGDGIELGQDLNGTLSKINSSYFGYKPASEITDYGCLYLCSANTPETSVKSDYIDMAEVRAVNQEKGDQGDTGPQGPQGPEGPQGATGSSGPVIYPEGKGESGKIYTGTSKKAPYVTYNDSYYIALGTVNVEPIGSNIVDINDIDGSDPINKWVKMDQFAAIYTDIVFADFAKLGSGVFSGDYMFSQNGINGSYDSFDATTGNTNSYTGFVPNIVMNAKTGSVSMCGKNVNFNADGTGNIGRVLIGDENGITSNKYNIELDYDNPENQNDGIASGTFESDAKLDDKSILILKGQSDTYNGGSLDIYPPYQEFTGDFIHHELTVINTMDNDVKVHGESKSGYNETILRAGRIISFKCIFINNLLYYFLENNN